MGKSQMKTICITWLIVSALVMISMIVSGTIFAIFYSIPRVKAYKKTQCLVMEQQRINGSCIQSLCDITRIDNLCKEGECHLTLLELKLEDPPLFRFNGTYNVTTQRPISTVTASNIRCYYDPKNIKASINVDYPMNVVAIFYTVLYGVAIFAVFGCLVLSNCICCVLR